MNKECLYSMYKGDDFVDVGTAKELAQRHKIKINTVRIRATPSNAKKNKGNRLRTFNLGPVDEM